MSQKKKIAVIGSGIGGLGAAWALSQRHEVHLFEAEPRLGGHTNTRDAGGVAVDTGFIVFNERTYPNLIALFEKLGVATQDSMMDFSVSLDGGKLEYGTTTIPALFAQPGNLFRPGFHRMWRDILRFFRAAPSFIAAPESAEMSLGEYLEREAYSPQFIHQHLLPMGAAIWSTNLDEMRAFPARSFIQFFVNHGLLQVEGRPQWRTVTGGAQNYVRRIRDAVTGQVHLGDPVARVIRAEGQVRLVTEAGRDERFDDAVLACHADQALALIAAPTDAEKAVLGAFRYQPNRVVLHEDAALMPRRRRAWASWNFLGHRLDTRGAGVSLTYWMNRLQSLPADRQIFATLNPLRAPDPARVWAEIDYRHPMFDANAIAAQPLVGGLQGEGGLWFCGAWCGWGFHEDGLASGLAVARALGAAPPWQVTEMSVAAAHATQARRQEAA